MKRTAALLRKDHLTPGPSPPWGRGEKICSPHQLAQKELSGGFKASTAWLEPFLSERRLQRITKAPDVAGMLDDLFW